MSTHEVMLYSPSKDNVVHTVFEIHAINGEMPILPVSS